MTFSHIRHYLAAISLVDDIAAVTNVALPSFTAAAASAVDLCSVISDTEKEEGRGYLALSGYTMPSM